MASQPPGIIIVASDKSEHPVPVPLAQNFGFLANMLEEQELVRQTRVPLDIEPGVLHTVLGYYKDRPQPSTSKAASASASATLSAEERKAKEEEEEKDNAALEAAQNAFLNKLKVIDLLETLTAVRFRHSVPCTSHMYIYEYISCVSDVGTRSMPTVIRAGDHALRHDSTHIRNELHP
jgi:transposase